MELRYSETEVSRAVLTAAKWPEHLEPGDHAYLAYDTDAEQEYVLARFVSEGLRRSERVLYFSDRRPPAVVRASLERHGLSVEQCVAKGHLSVLAAEDAYLDGGRFDAQRTREGWFTERDRTLARGYSALRVAVDMGWASRGIPGSERLLEYESSIAEIFDGGGLIGMCEFDRRLFDAQSLVALDEIHEGRRVVPSPSLLNTVASIIPTFNPDGIAVSGDLDIASRPAFEQAIREAMERSETDVFIDLTGVRFMDVGTLAVLVRATRFRKPGTVFMIEVLRLQLRRVLSLVGWASVPGIRLEDSRAHRDAEPL